MVIICMSFNSTRHFNALMSLLYQRLKIDIFPIILFNVCALLLTIIDVANEIMYDVVI